MKKRIEALDKAFHDGDEDKIRNRRIARHLLKKAFAVLAEELATGNSVLIPGLGWFRVETRPPLRRRDPRSGLLTEYAPRKMLRFSTGRTLDNAIRKLPVEDESGD